MSEISTIHSPWDVSCAEYAAQLTRYKSVSSTTISTVKLPVFIFDIALGFPGFETSSIHNPDNPDATNASESFNFTLCDNPPVEKNDCIFIHCQQTCVKGCYQRVMC